jgi:hypothetical protein
MRKRAIEPLVGRGVMRGQISTVRQRAENVSKIGLNPDTYAKMEKWIER